MERASVAGMILAALALAAASGCGTADSRNPFKPEASGLSKSMAILKSGDSATAEKTLRGILDQYPQSVDAHREYQNLLESKFRKRELIEKYDLLLDAFPRNAGFHYLRGRLAGEQDEQLRYFRRAQALDSDSFWPRYGIGFVLSKMRDFGAALRSLEKAAELNPDSALPHLLMGDIEFERRDLASARRHWANAAMLDPESPVPAVMSARSFFVEGERGTAFDLLVSSLARNGGGRGTCGMIREIIERSDSKPMYEQALKAANRALDSRASDSVEALAGFCCQRLGHLMKAREHFGRVIAGGGNPMVVLNDYRLLLVQLGEYGKAFAMWKKKLPPGVVFGPQNKAAVLFADLEAAAAAADKTPQDAAAVLRLGKALARAGWLPEAMSALRKAASMGSQAAEAELRSMEAHLRFIRRIDDLLSEGYGAAYRDEEPEDLDAVVAKIGAIALECVGEDLGKGNAEASFSFLGAYIDPSKPEASTLAAYFRKYNQYFILGQRNGRAPEATLMTIVYVNPEEKFAWADGGIAMEAVIGENFRIRSFGEHSGGNLIGAALYNGFYINLDSLAEKEYDNWGEFLRYARNPGDLANSSSYPPAAGESPDSIDDGLGLSTLILIRAYAERMTEEDVKGIEKFQGSDLPDRFRLLFEGAFAHEARHVADAKRYLPVGSRPFSALGLAIGEGFSGENIEAALEENAELAALAVSPSPGAELASIASFMPYPDEHRPHSKGFYDLLKALMKHMVENKAQFEGPGGVDFSLKLFRQLHRIPAKTLTSAARAMAQKRNLASMPDPGTEGK